MIAKTVAKNQMNPGITVLEIHFKLDGSCADVIMDQVEQSLRDGSETVVLDLSRTKYITLLGLSVLIQRASQAGILDKLDCYISNQWLSGLFAGLRWGQLF